MATTNEPRIRPNNRGTTRPGSRDLSGRPKGVVSWDEVSNQVLRDAIVAVTTAGAAIMLSRTIDQGALCVTILDGDQRVKEYPHSVEDAESTLRWAASMYSGD